MKFDFSVEQAEFLERPNRFLVMARLQATGEVVRAHCPDPGRLQELLLPGATLFLSRALDASGKRKTTHVLRFVIHPDPQAKGQLISLDSRLPNQVFAEGLVRGFFAPFVGYSEIAREVPFPLAEAGGVRSRIDYRLRHAGLPDCWVEVKSATLVEDGCALFPDAVTERGRRHVEELTHLHTTTGQRTAVVFIIQRPDVERFAPQEARDPRFAAALRTAAARGVEVCAYRCVLDLEQIELDAPVPVCL